MVPLWRAPYAVGVGYFACRSIRRRLRLFRSPLNTATHGGPPARGPTASAISLAAQYAAGSAYIAIAPYGYAWWAPHAWGAQNGPPDGRATAVRMRASARRARAHSTAAEAYARNAVST